MPRTANEAFFFAALILAHRALCDRAIFALEAAVKCRLPALFLPKIPMAELSVSSCRCSFDASLFNVETMSRFPPRIEVGHSILLTTIRTLSLTLTGASTTVHFPSSNSSGSTVSGKDVPCFYGEVLVYIQSPGRRMGQLGKSRFRFGEEQQCAQGF